MNKHEYESIGCPTNKYRKIAKQAFKAWKLQYQPNERCVIHHRDDTEEVITYNENHYERWGCDGDGTFEYGKYVIFMTRSEHARYHHIGEKSPTKRPEVRQKMSENNAHYWKGKALSEEHKQKISESEKCRVQSEETKQKISAAHKGKVLSEEHKQKISENHADVSGDKNPAKQPEVRQKISTTVKEQMLATKFLYSTYRSNGGDKKWQGFRKALANGDITFETQPVSVFINMEDLPCY